MADFVTTVLLEKAESWIFKDIKFESDKDILMASSYPTLEKILHILNRTILIFLLKFKAIPTARPQMPTTWICLSAALRP